MSLLFRPGRTPVHVLTISHKRRAIVRRKIKTAANMREDGRTMPEIRAALGVRREGR